MSSKNYTLIIEADTNDGDYVISENIIDEETLKIIEKVAKVIKESEYNHNWFNSEYGDPDKVPGIVYKDKLTKEEIELFNDFCPYGEYGIHTIVNIKISPKIEWQMLLGDGN